MGHNIEDIDSNVDCLLSSIATNKRIRCFYETTMDVKCVFCRQ